MIFLYLKQLQVDFVDNY